MEHQTCHPASCAIFPHACPVLSSAQAGDALVVPDGDVSIPIQAGRPDFEGLLATVAKETQAAHVGVYVAGACVGVRDQIWLAKDFWDAS